MGTSSCAEEFGARLRDLRNKRELSQQKLCSDLGISKAALSYYENGQRAPDIDILLKIADYFNVSADYLLGRTPNKTPNINKQAVLKYTGLSEAALATIMLFTRNRIDWDISISNGYFFKASELFNEIISSDFFCNRILDLFEYCNKYFSSKFELHTLETEYLSHLNDTHYVTIIFDSSESENEAKKRYCLEAEKIGIETDSDKAYRLEPNREQSILTNNEQLKADIIKISVRKEAMEFLEYLLNKSLSEAMNGLNAMLDKHVKDFEEKERDENGNNNPPKE